MGIDGRGKQKTENTTGGETRASDQSNVFALLWLFRAETAHPLNKNPSRKEPRKQSEKKEGEAAHTGTPRGEREDGAETGGKNGILLKFGFTIPVSNITIDIFRSFSATTREALIIPLDAPYSVIPRTVCFDTTAFSI